MGDPNWRHGAYADTEASTLTTPHLQSSNNLQGSSSDYLQKDIILSRLGGYGGDDYMGLGAHLEPAIGGFSAGASIKGYPSPLEDPNLLRQRQDTALGATFGIPDMTNERPGSFRKAGSPGAPAGESNILFVDGLPSYCSRREVGHLFRPFIGFRDIKVVHKEPRRSGDMAMVLCFVEFADVKCALTALEALQGYKFDDKKPDSPILRIHFAHFPCRLPSDRVEQKFGGPW